MTIETTIERGRKAFHAGLPCSPVLDAGFVAEVCAAPESTVDLLTAWDRGWTEANLADPVAGMLTATEVEELREADDRTLIALHNIEVMGQSCLRVGDTRRSDDIYAVVVDELKARGAAITEGALIG